MPTTPRSIRGRLVALAVVTAGVSWLSAAGHQAHADDGVCVTGYRAAARTGAVTASVVKGAADVARAAGAAGRTARDLTRTGGSAAMTMAQAGRLAGVPCGRVAPADEVSRTVQRAAALLGLAGLARTDGVLGVASGSALPGVPNVVPDLSVLPDLPGVPPVPRVSKALPKVPKVAVVPRGITDSVGGVVDGVQPQQAPAPKRKADDLGVGGLSGITRLTGGLLGGALLH
ncbi:hypothetical protein [Herbidospora sp. NBRC 101105]|uniref:hypothetical protein n=1 Tax=Herbidospora sp. NBRC 101105 TaxID=3032195 RepID=UPI0024A06D66|nr:hypothetical protein [Herbidospora sp. NBRC 101105]GLX96281.1 hypothetical protein Hesp01_42310 [Herbidospora sp. NBRC 101105]